MGFQGDLDSFGLANIFQNLAANQQSGHLHVYDNKTELYLVFSKGSIRSVRPGNRQTISLGEILVARKLITHDVLATALDTQKTNDHLLGDTLVEQGACTAEDINAALRFQMEEDIYDLFFWHGARFKFDDAFVDTTVIRRDLRIADVRLNTSGLILEALRRLDEWGRLQEILPSFAIIAVIPEARQTDAFFASLTEDEQRIISFADGVNNIDAITHKSYLGRYAVVVLLAKLFQNGDAREATVAELKATAEKLTLQGEIAIATSLQQRLLELHPGDLDVMQAQAENLVSLAQPAAAAQGFHRLAEARCGEQDMEAALAAVTQAVELAPDDLEGLERAANLNLLADRPRSAAAFWLKIIRANEEAGDPRKALEKLTQALTDLPEQPDFSKIEARLLMELGDKTGAIAAYEKQATAFSAKGDTQAAIAAYRNIIRIDGARAPSLEKRIKGLQTGDSQKRKEKTGLLVKVAAIIGLLGILGLAAVNEVRTKLNTTAALAAVEGVEEKNKTALIEVQVKELQAARATLADAVPAFSLFNNETLTARQAAIDEILRMIEKDEKIELERRANIVSRWKILCESASANLGIEAEATLRDLRQIAKNTPTSAAGKDALKLIQDWDDRQHQTGEQLVGLFAIIHDRKADPKTRFNAFQKICQTAPAALNQKHPNGLQNATVPVLLTTLSTTGISLPAEVRVNGKKWATRTPSYVEIPCSGDAEITLHRRGFGHRQRGTSLVLDGALKASYTVTLERTARWRLPLRGGVVARPLISPDGQLVFAATVDGEIVAVQASTGRIRWTTRKQADFPKGLSFKQPLETLAKNMLVAIDQNGFIVALNSQNGKRLWPTSGKGALWNHLPIASVVNRARARTGGSAIAGLLVTSRSGSPLYQIESQAGTIRWPSGTTAAQALRKKIGTPAGLPFVLPTAKRVLLLGEDGHLHILLSDGTYGSRVRVAPGRIQGTPLFLADNGEERVRIFSFVEGKGLWAHTVSAWRKPVVKKLWQQATLRKERLAAPLLVAGAKGEMLIAGFQSGRLVSINIVSGDVTEIITNDKTAVAASGEMAWANGRLYVPCEKRPTPLLIGYQFSSKKETGAKKNPARLVRAWQFSGSQGQRISGVAIHASTRGHRMIVFGDQSGIFCLDAEE